MAIDATSLVTTISGTTSNSYVTLQEFVDYADLRLHVDAFREAGADDRVRALIMAARRLNRENWLGAPATATQSLSWPRVEVRKHDNVRTYRTGVYYDEYDATEIPEIIKHAQYELALAYLEGFEAAGEREMKSFQADGISVTFEPHAVKGEVLPAAVARLIAPLTRGNRLVRA